MTLSALAAVSIVAVLASLSANADPAGPSRVTVSVSTAAAGDPVPGDFLGLSFEALALPKIARYAGQGNLPMLMRSLGRGVMRFGGATVDTRTAWSNGGPPPAWANGVVTPVDLNGIGQLAAETGWGVLLGVNIGHYDPQAAASEVAYAHSALGGALDGIELGNEPDAFAHNGLRAYPWTYDTYRADAYDYWQAITAAFPGARLAGPDVSSPPRYTWVRHEASDATPSLLTAHWYTTSCYTSPTVARLMSFATRRSQQRSVAQLAAISTSSGVPLRLDETNNISCGGFTGVSNTFGGALWAVDYLAHVMTAGLAGVNFHDLPERCTGYSPLCSPTSADAAAGHLQAQPEWYALLLARMLLGDRPLGAVSRPRATNLSITAFASSHGRLHLVVVDDAGPGAPPVTLRLRVPKAYGSGTILRLSAPSPTATAGVTLGGRGVAPDGSWQPPARLPKLHGRPGALTFKISSASAALVTLIPRPGAKPPSPPPFALRAPRR